MFASEIPDVQFPMNTYGRMSTNINVITGLNIFFVVKLNERFKLPSQILYVIMKNNRLIIYIR